MAFNRPTLTDLINRTWADVASRLSSDDIMRRSDAPVFARALAGLAHGIYGALVWLARQLIYDTADGEYLRRWAAIWGVNPLAATYATGSVTFTGSNGVVIPAGTVLVGYAGQLYSTDAEVTIAAGTALATVTALASGYGANVAAGQTFVLQSPVSGVNASAIAGAMTGGADAETDASLLARFLKRLRQPPQGGSKSDYEQWAFAASPAVTRVYVAPIESGLGTVTVRFMMDNAYSNGIPLAGDVATVQAYIDNVRPVTAVAYVAAPVAAPLNFTISGLSPSTAAVKAAITAELTDLVKREAAPGGTLLLSHITEAIAAASGVNDFTLVSPAANVVNTTGNISTMGAIAWT